MRRERIIHSVLITTILVVGFIMLRIHYDTSLLKNSKKNKYWVNKTFSTKTYNFVAMGDSRCVYGLSPQKIQEILPGRQCFNMGYLGCGFYEPLLKMGLARCKNEPGTIILLAITPRSLSDYQSSIDCTKLKQILAISFEQRLWTQYFPYTRALFNNFRVSNLTAFPKNTRFEFHLNGWIAAHTKNKYENQSDKRYLQIFQHSRSRQGVEVLSFVKKAAKKKFMVIGFFPPISESLQVIENEKSGFLRKTFIDMFTKNGGFWLNFLDKYETFDGSHLHAKSAQRFSTDLALKIKNEILVY
ncbi:hypothetical protein [Candidatus Uabimicrobium sp. HlEnr_7]|uniref:hypothetical protein n=1 Tax=Candidatus Uabimicrobium helgolandensis TaxID=3095367 RepID=UPI0035573CE6